MRSTEGKRLSLGRVVAALAAVAVFLALVLVAQIQLLFGEHAAEEMMPASRRAIELPELKTSAIWPDANGISTDGRSLFVSKIAAEPPVVPPLEPPPPQPPQDQLSLVAILIAPAGKFALLRSQQLQELRQIEEGGEMAGWTLSKVERDRVIIEHRGQQTILYLPDTIPGPSDDQDNQAERTEP